MEWFDVLMVAEGLPWLEAVLEFITDGFEMVMNGLAGIELIGMEG